MRIEVPDSVRRDATNCPHYFGCLATGSCGDREICKVAYAHMAGACFALPPITGSFVPIAYVSDMASYVPVQFVNISTPKGISISTEH